MQEYEEMFLCKPCAEKIKDFKTVEKVKYVQSVTNKGTCEQCGCRRFGYICKVKFRDLEKK